MGNDPILLELAIRIAVTYHAGQLDKGNSPYILHPLRVMDSVDTIDEKIVAVLHDTVEDTDMTLQQLRNEGFPDYLVNSIALLTRTPDISYSDYIRHIKYDPIARKVKLADMRDNSDLTRLHDLENKHLKMVKKYHKATLYLRDI